MKEALIVVDYQKDFVDGSLGFPKAQSIRPYIVEKIEDAISSNKDLIFTFDTHHQDYLQTHEGRLLPVVHTIKNTEGWELDMALRPFGKKAKYTFEKPTFGSFELAQCLRSEGYDKVELCGLVLDICVLANAILARASLPEAAIVVDLKATASLTDEKTSASVSILESQHIQVRQ